MAAGIRLFRHEEEEEDNEESRNCRMRNKDKDKDKEDEDEKKKERTRKRISQQRSAGTPASPPPPKRPSRVAAVHDVPGAAAEVPMMKIPTTMKSTYLRPARTSAARWC